MEAIMIFLSLLVLLSVVAQAFQSKSNLAFQARRENSILRHMELLLEESQKEIASLRKENSEQREQLSEMQAEIAELKANLILLLNAVERLNASEITQRAIDAVRASVNEVLSNAKKKPPQRLIKLDKDEGA